MDNLNEALKTEFREYFMWKASREFGNDYEKDRRAWLYIANRFLGDVIENGLYVGDDADDWSKTQRGFIKILRQMLNDILKGENATEVLLDRKKKPKRFLQDWHVAYSVHTKRSLFGRSYEQAVGDVSALSGVEPRKVQKIYAKHKADFGTPFFKDLEARTHHNFRYAGWTEFQLILRPEHLTPTGRKLREIFSDR